MIIRQNLPWRNCSYWRAKLMQASEVCGVGWQAIPWIDDSYV